MWFDSPKSASDTRLSSFGPQSVVASERDSTSQSWTTLSWQTLSRKPPSARNQREVAGRFNGANWPT